MEAYDWLKVVTSRFEPSLARFTWFGDVTRRRAAKGRGAR